MSALENIFGPTLLKGGEEVPTSSLQQLDGVMVYFSAHWCGPCRGFTPKLVESYNKMKAAGKNFEIIFASGDRDQSSFDGYYNTMPWMALPFSARELKEKLSAKYKVRGIPTLVVLDGDGNLITDGGRAAVTNDPSGENFPWHPPSFLECLGSTFVDNAGTTYGLDRLEGKIIGIYFSAHWCPPCKRFTPKLVALYNKLKQQGKPFEIIFASSDRDEAAFDGYFGEMPWLAVPYADRARKGQLSDRFKVEGIPTFVVLNGLEGKVITAEGTGAVSSDEEGVDFPWYPKPVNSMGVAASKLNSTPGLVIFCETAEEEAQMKLMLTPLAEKEIAAAGGEPDLMFATCLNSHELAGRVKGLMKLNENSPGVTVGIISVPARGSFHSTLKPQDITPESLANFLDFYKQGALEKIAFS